MHVNAVLPSLTAWWSRQRSRIAGIGGGRAAAAAVVLVLAIDVVALASIVAARSEAREAAITELAEQTRSQARAIEALLATLRADLAFLASSSRLAVTFENLDSEEPLSRRWARLDAEGTLLLFAEGHPELVALELTLADGSVVAAVARQGATDGPREDPIAVSRAPASTENTLTLEAPFQAGGRLWAAADPSRLLSTLAPLGPSSGLRLRASQTEPNSETRILEPVDTRGWLPEGPLFLERAAPDGPLLAAVERLAERWRTIVLLNLAVLSLGLPLAVLAVRAARSAAQLTAERESAEQRREHAEQRRELEERIWQQERLASVGRLASNLAHEINNPLAGMTNHMVLLEGELRNADSPAAQRRLPLLREGLERVRDIVQRALQLANPGRGDRREPVDLVRLTEQTIELVCGADGSSRVRFEVVGERRALTLEGERARLHQLVTNLLVNAVAFGEDRPIDVRLRGDGETISLVVEDRGPGIDPAIAERLFEPFVSGRGSTGLGLAVCLGVARQYGGTIVGGDRDGGGARFTVRLPADGGPAILRREAS